jgi:stage IV sporulation protein FB
MSSEPHGLRLGSVAGTSLFVQPSFLILAGFFVLLELQVRAPIEQALLWIPTLFLSVLVHELAHALTIAALGFGSSVIVLGGAGGVTMNERRARPWQNLLISAAGPLASFALGLLIFWLAQRVPFLTEDAMMRHLTPMMIRANIFWAIFNFLPIYPLDGGSVLHNFLLMFTRGRTAFVISVWVSIVLAALIAIAGLFTRNFLMAIIAAMLVMQNFQRWSAFKEYGSHD